MSARNRTRSGFTLVELLVVIAIIGMLVGLLLPAITAARNRAKLTMCINRQQELGKAIIHFESVKGVFPTCLKQETKTAAGATTRVTMSWAVQILQYFDRQDIWEAFRDKNVIDWSPPPGIVNQLVCPLDTDALSNPPAADVYGAVAPLSYVVNRGIFRDSTLMTTTPPIQPADTKKISATDAQIKSQARTPMLSERLSVPNIQNPALTIQTGPWYHRMKQSDSTTPPMAANVTFTSLNFSCSPMPAPTAAPLPSIPLTANSLTSNHAGGVVITFCDGHSDFVISDTVWLNEFDAGPTN